MRRRRVSTAIAIIVLIPVTGCTGHVTTSELVCVQTFMSGHVQRVAQVRTDRFLGRVPETRARGLGGQFAVDYRPDVQVDTVPSNGHHDPASPMERVLLRTIPDFKEELQPVAYAFDP